MDMSCDQQTAEVSHLMHNQKLAALKYKNYYVGRISVSCGESLYGEGDTSSKPDRKGKKNKAGVEEFERILEVYSGGPGKKLKEEGPGR